MKTKIRLAKKDWTEYSNKKQTEVYLSLLNQGVDVWNTWREENGELFLDLREVQFGLKDFSGINLSGCNLSGSIFTKCNFYQANLGYVYGVGTDIVNCNISQCNLSGAYFDSCNFNITSFLYSNLRICSLVGSSLFMCEFINSDLRKANLSSTQAEQAKFSNVVLSNTNFEAANLREATLRGVHIFDCNFKSSILVDADFSNSKIENCNVFGASVWRTKLDNSEQINLIVSEGDTHQLSVDDLNIAQFLYTILDNPKLRNMLDTITSKTVLILGRFTEERKRVLNEIKKSLKEKNLVPIIFDFEPPHNRDLKETVVTLAHLAKFIIADITDPKSIPMELMAIIPVLPSVPVQPVILRGQEPWAMFGSLTRYPWVLNTFYYTDAQHLVDNLDVTIIGSVENYLATNNVTKQNY